MKARVLARDECVNDEELRLLVLRHAESLEDQTEKVAEVLTSAFGADDAEAVVSALADVSDARIDAILGEVDLGEEKETEDEEGKEAGLAAFAQALAAKGRHDVARSAYQRLLKTKTDVAAASALPLLETFQPVTQPTLAAEVINTRARRPATEWVTWLSAAVQESRLAARPDEQGLEGAIRTP
jgi:hypothetical protein